MISIQTSALFNTILNERIATARIVNMQAMSFDEFCEYLADGASITASDVSAVMKRLERMLPRLMALNIKVQASPNGILFYPAVSGSITQSELRTQLTERKKALVKAGNLQAAEEIDVNRDVTGSDLPISALTAGINVSLPKKMRNDFDSDVTFKRVTKAQVTEIIDDNDGDDGNNDDVNPGDDNTGSGTQNSGTDSGNTGQGTLYTLSISSANASQGSVDTSVNKQYSAGSRVTIKATPQSGYAFDRWSDGSTVNPRNITLNQDVTLTASFKTASVTPPGEDDDDSPFDGGM